MVQRRPAVQIRRLNDGFGDAAADASFSADKAAIRGCGSSNLCRNGGGGDTKISRSLQQRGWESIGSDSAAEQELSQASQAHDGWAQERLIRLAMIGSSLSSGGDET